MPKQLGILKLLLYKFPLEGSSRVMRSLICSRTSQLILLFLHHQLQQKTDLYSPPKKDIQVLEIWKTHNHYYIKTEMKG